MVLRRYLLDEIFGNPWSYCLPKWRIFEQLAASQQPGHYIWDYICLLRTSRPTMDSALAEGRGILLRLIARDKNGRYRALERRARVLAEEAQAQAKDGSADV